MVEKHATGFGIIMCRTLKTILKTIFCTMKKNLCTCITLVNHFLFMLQVHRSLIQMLVDGKSVLKAMELIKITRPKVCYNSSV